ncbi:MAG: Holliday junction branch migration protein RuvA [Candidatus Portnoybacteria bacterium]|jgi:Holliday junction DNA helicase RuvA|nr:Holliday junction branch migration protein RuvA [Candidatus Portnoybacteria bacterium]
MITSLRGKILVKAEKHIIVEAGGVGFKVFCAEKTLKKIPPAGEEAKLFTYLSVKENGWDLFGFLTADDLEMFELLITIPGIGPKTAAGILGGASVEDLQEAIVLGDETILARVSGIGKKVAQKIVIELKTKVKKLAKGSGDKFKVADDIEIIDALVVLGYKLYEARDALKSLPSDIKGIENKVKEALKRLGKK